MAVTSIVEDWTGISGSGEVNLTSETGSLTRRFIVTFNNSDPTSNRPFMALNASSGGIDIPQYWDFHPYDSSFYVRRKTVAPFNGPTSWVVTVEYEYLKNPLLEPYSIQFIPQMSNEPLDKAIRLSGGSEIADKNLCNSADEPFDPPIQEEIYDFAIIIKRNEANFAMGTAQQYLNTVNADLFKIKNKQNNILIFDVGTVRCKNIQADEQRHGPTWYYTVTYEFVVRSDGWLRRILDQGFREKISGDYKSITDTDGNPITMPMKLDGAGSKLSASADPVFLTFQTKKTKQFSYFGFYTV